MTCSMLDSYNSALLLERRSADLIPVISSINDCISSAPCLLAIAKLELEIVAILTVVLVVDEFHPCTRSAMPLVYILCAPLSAMAPRRSNSWMRRTAPSSSCAASSA